MELLEKKGKSAVEKKAKLLKVSFQPKKGIHAQEVINRCTARLVAFNAKNLDSEIQEEESKLARSSMPISQRSIGEDLPTSARDIQTSRPISEKLPVLTKSQSRQDLLKDKLTSKHIMKKCCEVRLESLHRKTPVQIQAPKASLTSEELEKDGYILKKLLTAFDPTHKPAVMDHSLKRYYQQQNKFVSYRMFRDNYLMAVKGVVHVLESDEK